MSTPPLSDEEFDALFRQGLERYPELPDDPAAWLGMELRLDGAGRAERLRRRVLRLLGAETVALGLLAWSLLHWVDGRVSPTGRVSPAEVVVVSPPAATAVAAARSLAADAPTASPAAGTALPAGQPQPVGVASASPTSVVPGAPVSRLATAQLAAAQAARPHPLAGQLLAAIATDDTHSGAVLAGRQRQRALVVGVVAGTRQATKQAASQIGRLNGVGEEATHRPLVVATGRHISTSQTLVPAEEHRTTRHLAATHAATEAAVLVAATGRPATAEAISRPARPTRHVAGRLAPASSLAASYHAASHPAAFTRAAQAAGTGHEAQATSTAATDNAALASVGLLDPRLGHLVLPATSLPTPLALLPEPASLPTQPAPAPVLDAYRLRVGLVASPEFSTVNLNYVPAAGWSMGGYLDYRLARRWHLSAGYLLTLKRYAAESYDYHAPTDYGHPKWVISDVDAVCRIVDLPVNLRYDFWQRPGRQAFASAGLSSLLMRDERYTYHYDDLNGRPLAPATWDYVNGSQHYFKVLNLSAGYERALGQRWSVQAEPFVKLPLAGIGFGSVKLASAGVFFSLRYGLLARPAPPTP